MILGAVIVLITFQIAFCLGYLMGHANSSKNIVKNYDEQSNSGIKKLENQQISKKTLSIDDSKFVTNVKHSLKNEGVFLGNQTIVDDDVSYSVSKLSQLKQKK